MKPRTKIAKIFNLGAKFKLTVLELTVSNLYSNLYSYYSQNKMINFMFMSYNLSF